MNDLFDFTQLDELMSADPDELRQVLWDLFTDFRKSFAALPEKASSGGLGDISMEAHQLRGVSASFGLKRLSDTARDLEMAAGEGNVEKSRELITTVRELLDESERELKVQRPEYF